MDTESAKEILERAMAAVDSAKIEGDLREIAFSKAVDLIAGAESHPIVPQAQVSEAVDDGSKSSVKLIADRLKLNVDVVEEVFAVSENGLDIVVGFGALAQDKSNAAREIALLVTAGRQALKLEEWTSVKHVRKMADHYGKNDPSNFGSTIKGMEKHLKMRGSSQSRELQLRMPGWEAATKLVSKLGGVE